MTNASSRLSGLPVAMLFGACALLVAAATGGLARSFIDPDESAHYVNALFVGDWLRAGMPSPMPFAVDFYHHFPKLSIGHWPPGWYALLAPVFAVLRPSPFGATLIGAFVAGLPAVIVAWGLRRTGHARLGIAAGLLYLLLPLVVHSERHFLVDQPVSLVIGLAAIAWFHASAAPGLIRFLLFGALTAAAMLIKGNGALLGLVPLIDIALTRRWALLRDWRLWVAGAATLLVVAPWYYVSFRISAGGFNYAPGIDYALASLTTDLVTMVDNVGFGGCVLALFGLWFARAHEDTRRIAALAVAVIVATLLFQAAVPVALVPRYVLPLLPWLAVLAGIGLAGLWRLGAGARIGGGLLVVTALTPAAVALVELEPKVDIGAPALAAAIRARPGIWMVDGRAGGEGAVIAAAAYADGGARRVWVARASQWLSTSDFMGRQYRLTARSGVEARSVLDRLGVAGVVTIAERDRLAYPHSRVLRAGLVGDGFAGETVRFAVGSGSATTAVRGTAVRPNLDLLNGQATSNNAAAMGAMLP